MVTLHPSELQVDDYTTAIERAGFEMEAVRENTEYEFISDQATNACQKYGVKSISLGAQKHEDRTEA